MNTKIVIATALATLIATSFHFSARADITTGLKGYWTFDAGSGSTAVDSSGNGNDGTLTNFADTGFTTMWTNGILANAIVFNQNGETTNYVSVPSSTSINAGQVAKEWTLSAWIKPSVAGGSQVANAGIIAKGKLNSKDALYLSGGKLQTRLRNTAGTGTMTATGTTTPSANQWYHVVGIVKEPRQGGLGSEALIYVNGVQESSTDANTFTTTFSSTEPLVIGAREDANGNVNLPFKGVLDEVRIYSRALTNDIWQLYTNKVTSLSIASQPRSVTCYSNDTAVFSAAVDSKTILPLNYQLWFTNATSTNLMFAAASSSLTGTFTLPNVTNGNAGNYFLVISNAAGVVTTSAPAMLTVLALPAPDTSSGLVGWWKLDDASGSGTAADSSGNGNNGALTNFTDTTFMSQWGAGIIGGALSFNGDGGASNVVAVPSLGTPAPPVLDFNASPVFTLSAWVNASLTQTNEAAIVAKGTGGGGEQYVLELNGGKFRFFVRDANGVSYNITSAVAANGVWQHVAAVLNATNGLMNLYVNGALAGSAVAPFSLLAANHEVAFGNRQSGTGNYNDPFTGALDDVRVYSRDLTSADVLALYATAAFPLIATQYPVTYTNLYTLYQGASPTFKLGVTGLSPLSYQWYTNGVPDAGGTNSAYQFHNLPLGGITNYCIVTNSLGSATSIVWTATVVTAPTAPYAQSVQGLNPIGYWRLDEADDTLSDGNPGAIAHDYLGGNDGVYTNTALGNDGYGVGLSNQFGYYPASDPETAARFSSYGGVDNGALQIAGVDFSTPAGTNRAFSVAAWAHGSSAQIAGAGIVAKGFGNGGEQFDLDAVNTPRCFRFFVRDAAGVTHGFTSTFALDGNWHHVVGVCDPANGKVSLYVDGALLGTASITVTGGILSSTRLMGIGSRSSSSTSHNDLVFNGDINDVAVYNYALSAAQVLSNYLAAGLPPKITQNPLSSTNVDEGTTLIVPAGGGGGTPPMVFQWYDVTSGLPGVAVAGQTNASLVISNINALAYNGHSLALSISNAYGSPYSSSVFVTVNSGAPAVTVAPSSVTVYSNLPVVFRATATGSEPFTYQWQTNSIPVPNATNATYTSIAGIGSVTITCVITGPGGPGSASATLTGVALPSDGYGLAILADQPLAYWRLDEPLFAAVANDYVGGHNADYSNTTNGLPGFSPLDPDTAAGFGMNGVTSGSMALEENNGVSPIDFSTQGTNASFSVEVWIKAPHPQTGGIVCKGNGHAEQFDLDFNGGVFRFFGRDAAGATHGPSTTLQPDGLWHHVVGVYNATNIYFGTNGLVTLFVDGVVKGASTMTPGLGIFPPGAFLTSIGARRNDVTGLYDLQCHNTVLDEVAIYGYALSTNQVVAHYSNTALPPQFVRDLQSQTYAYVGFPMSLSVLATSSTPMTYQWQSYGTNLVDGGEISGSHTNTLSLGIAEFSDSGGTYQVFVTNQATIIPAASTLATLTVLPQLQFGCQWASQGSATSVPAYTSANVLQLTDGGGSEAASSFFGYPVYIGAFRATYTYQDVGGGGADGTAFVVQNDARGAAALGGAGGGLGYLGITNSAALEFNIFANNSVGFALRTNGITGTPYVSASPINLASGDPIDVTLLYANGVLSMTLTDAVALASFTFTTNLNILAAVGTNTAYVGITGGDGGTASTQVVSNFTFVSLPTLAIQPTAGNNVTITWPQAVGGGYELQASPSLVSGWTNVTPLPSSGGGFYQITRPASGTSLFYRLINP